MLSKLTLMGLHNFSDGSIWDDITLPEGLNKEALVNEILRQAAEFPLLYPDEDYMKLQIKAFFIKWNRNFTKWYQIYQANYEPLYNVDVTTTREEHGTNEESGSTSGSSSSGNTAIQQKAAYDSETFQNTEKNTSDTDIETSSESEGNSKHDIAITEIKRGNQGVTMSQEMWLMEANLWYWNLYQHIAEIFVSEFCVCVYV